MFVIGYRRESVTCEADEVYRIEALQEVQDLGLDFNNAHMQALWWEAQ